MLTILYSVVSNIPEDLSEKKLLIFFMISPFIHNHISTSFGILSTIPSVWFGLIFLNELSKIIFLAIHIVIQQFRKHVLTDEIVALSKWLWEVSYLMNHRFISSHQTYNYKYIRISIYVDRQRITMSKKIITLFTNLFI